jgi:hypothetical protein
MRLYSDGAWRAFLRVWPVVLTITPTDARAVALRDATTAALDRSPYSSRGMIFKFCAIAALQGETGPFAAVWRVAGERSCFLSVPQSGSPPRVVRNAVFDERSGAVTLAAASSVHGGRSGAGRRTHDILRSCAQVVGLG